MGVALPGIKLPSSVTVRQRYGHPGCHRGGIDGSEMSHWRGRRMIIELKVDEEDAEALGEALEAYLGDLRFEIAHTDSIDFKAGLREQEQRVERVFAMLKAAHGEHVV